MAKEKGASTANQLTAYCMKTKEKGVVIRDAVIDINNNRYIAKGNDGKGNKLTTILGKANAEAFVKSGQASKGKGWGK